VQTTNAPHYEYRWLKATRDILFCTFSSTVHAYYSLTNCMTELLRLTVTNSSTYNYTESDTALRRQ